MIDGWGISGEIGLRGLSRNLTDNKSSLVQVMAWCCQATWANFNLGLCHHSTSLGHNELTHSGLGMQIYIINLGILYNLILIDISLNFVLVGPVDNNSSLVQVLVCTDKVTTWAKVDQVSCHNMALLGDNELMAGRLLSTKAMLIYDYSTT